MAMVNSLTNVKDSRWLQLEVCREFQRNKCTRPDTECKFAHPPANVEVQNGRVIACYDSTKGRCNREKPPCKYFHPPEHLKNQLLINGRNHLVLKNALLQQLPLQPVLPAAVASTNPYLANLPAMATTSFNPYLTPTPMMPGMVPADAMAAPLSVVPTPLVASQKVSRTDRLEVCREYQRGNCKRAETECRFAHPPDHVTVDSTEGMVTVCMDFVKGRCTREQCRYFHPPPHLQAQLKAAQSRANAAAVPHVVETLVGKKRPRDHADDLILIPSAEQGVCGTLFQAFPGMVPYTKRPALDKSGIPVYQPSTAAYQQALAMQVQQPFVPVSLPMMHSSAMASTATGTAICNAASVTYCDEKGQLLDTLPVCRDFKSSQCKRPQCRYVHLVEDYVEVVDGKVTVCRDAMKGKCNRPLCKYYHVPLPLPFFTTLL
ncbi:muscleblind-like protein 1 isoform X3 [Centruroides sculpturatus]|uniref:muscleblind-like protein 1 isoform X3 n=1 Tax=Centruroides sculpturatus TaxID=218467 RepID=UPI000C6E53BD|nr:muscleblind-like protein 1 isoform X3 [Centruroides sculpturatus]